MLADLLDRVAIICESTGGTGAVGLDVLGALGATGAATGAATGVTGAATGAATGDATGVVTGDATGAATGEPGTWLALRVMIANVRPLEPMTEVQLALPGAVRLAIGTVNTALAVLRAHVEPCAACSGRAIAANAHSAAQDGRECTPRSAAAAAPITLTESREAALVDVAAASTTV